MQLHTLVLISVLFIAYIFPASHVYSATTTPKKTTTTTTTVKKTTTTTTPKKPNLISIPLIVKKLL